MNSSGNTLLLTRADVAALLTLEECIGAVEEAFREHGLGRTSAPTVLGVPAIDGGFHIKAALLHLASGAYFCAKLNGNFIHNSERFSMPNIQGLIILCDARNGYPLAVMDSIEITILRTGAATAVAAKYLARGDSKIATICGCGNQGRIQLRALMKVLPLQRVFAVDVDTLKMERFAAELSTELKVEIAPVNDVAAAVRESDLCVTCTPARKFFIRKDDVKPGMFLAAVGADNEEKQEIDPRLLASGKVVADILEQCVEIGDVHHAVAAGLMNSSHVHAELGEIVAGRKPGRISAEEIIVFDSTGTALQDVAAAAIVYQRALKLVPVSRFSFQTD
jgi:alanine dehydrogenase